MGWVSESVADGGATFDEMCAITNRDWHWSIVSNSSSNSQLAGVLASVLFTGMVLILGRKSAASTYQQTIVLFSVSFVSLALDSYLFSLTSGIRPVVDHV
ncbi:hypothetical protein ACW9HQ_50265, partial [Nocardia gipuzkoensis]